MKCYATAQKRIGHLQAADSVAREGVMLRYLSSKTNTVNLEHDL